MKSNASSRSAATNAVARIQLIWTLGAALLVLTSMHADASQVSIQFHFTSFTSKLDLSIPPGVPPSPLPQVFVGGQQVVSYTPDVPFNVTQSFGQSVEFHEVSTSGVTQVEQIHNLVQFTPGPTANVAVGQEFLLGSFHLVDGTWFGGADIAFNMTTVSSDSALDGHQYDDTLRMVFNPFDLNPDVSADWFYLVNQKAAGCPTSGSLAVGCTTLRVYELFGSPIPGGDGISNAGDVQLWGKIGSLDPIEFKDPTGGLFLSNSFNANPSRAATPAPPAFPLFATGVGILGLFGWRTKRKALAV